MARVDTSTPVTSPNRHASAHAAASEHPVITSLEPGEAWGYCYPDDVAVGSG